MGHELFMQGGKNNRQDIVDTFAFVYECLYFCDAERLGDYAWKHGSGEEVPALSNSEAKAVLKVMAKNNILAPTFQRLAIN